MRRIDELYLHYPFYGSRQMARHLAREGVTAGRHRVRRLMRLLGLEAIYRKPRTTVANPEHRVYPYRSGQPVHQHRVHGSAGGRRSSKRRWHSRHGHQVVRPGYEGVRD